MRYVHTVMIPAARRPYAIAAGTVVGGAVAALVFTRAVVPSCFPLDPPSDDLPADAFEPTVVGEHEPAVPEGFDAGALDDAAIAIGDGDDRRRRSRRSGGERDEPRDGPATDRAVYRDEAGIYVVSREHVERTLERGSATGGATAHRHVEGDDVVGYRLSGVGGSPLARLGLRNGDVLTSINGMRIDSADSALGAFGRLRDSDRLHVVVLRGGRRIGLRYRIE